MKKLIILLFALVVIVSCDDDDLIVSPHTKLGSEQAITSENDLQLAIYAVYNRMTPYQYYGSRFLTCADMMGDDAIDPLFGSQWMTTYMNYSYTKVNATTEVYTRVYGAIAHINDVLLRSKGLEETDRKKTLMAEMKALRAILHFDIAKLYGPLPINLGKGKIKADALCVPIMEKVKDPKDYEGMLRKTTSEVYQFITSELETVIPLMDSGRDNGYLGVNGAKAFLSRAYLYMGDYANSLKYANQIIKSGLYSLIPKDNYIGSWKQEYSNESIFELVYLPDDNESWNSIGYVVMANSSGGGYKDIIATKKFEALMKADPEDVRFEIFQYYDSYTKGDGYLPMKKYPGKEDDVKVNNVKVVRYSEIILIAAECQLKLGNVGEAASLLNSLREQRTTTEPTKYDESLTIENILYERRLELFCEGHRAWDLWRNQMPVVRWTTPTEKEELGYKDDRSKGIINFDDHLCLLPIDEAQLKLLPKEYQESQQNPGY